VLVTISPRGGTLPVRLRYRIAPEAAHAQAAPAAPRRVRIQIAGTTVAHDNPAGHAWDMVGGEADQVVGTVRIHPGQHSDGDRHDHADGLWWGSRLAVHAGFRHHARLGSALIRLAVSSAHARGAALFLAHVQQQNEALFHRLHWQTLRPLTLHGRPHRLMQADLAHYPPCLDPVTGFVQRSVAPSAQA
jgi:putative N-acetyltransferase (TIGR04045 family)